MFKALLFTSNRPLFANIDDRFIDQLPADALTSNDRRQVTGACYSFVKPTPVQAPGLVVYAKEVAEMLDLTEADCQSEQFLQVMSGSQVLPNMRPYAMCYGGHQFGNWAGQLGDGRAINLCELKNKAGEHWAIQLKGAGETPYSRTADGLAVLRSSVREFLCSEAMFHLGVPTTRALSLVTTGEKIVRDMFYDGRPEYEPGAVVCRVAPSFIRFGNFEILAIRQEYKELRALANFTIAHYYPELLQDHEADSKALYIAFFEAVCARTLAMIVHWQRVGFVHGVMNTDNMSILGLTIDYGPYGWLDSYEPDWTPNTTDAQHKRYRYRNQPQIALWNLLQLANSLYPLIEQSEPLEAALHNFNDECQAQVLAMHGAKLGLNNFSDQDQPLIDALLALLSEQETDMTLFFHSLSQSSNPNYQSVQDAFYQPEAHSDDYQQRWNVWFTQYQQRLLADEPSDEARKETMRQVNPVYIFRNYLAQQAIDKAHDGDYSMIHDLLDVLRNPYSEQEGKAHYASKRPDWAKTKPGCSMLSCSS